MKQTRVIVIDSEKQEVREEVWEGDTLPKLQATAAKSSGLVDVVRLTKNIDLWVDDEGLLHDPMYFFRFRFSGQDVRVYAGNGVIAGVNSEGETVSVPEGLTAELVRPAIKFDSIKEAHD